MIRLTNLYLLNELLPLYNNDMVLKQLLILCGPAFTYVLCTVVDVRGDLRPFSPRLCFFIVLNVIYLFTVMIH